MGAYYCVKEPGECRGQCDICPQPPVEKEVKTTTGGTKFDQGKPPISLIPRTAVEAEARVLAFGANKYGKHNWRKGMDWSRVIDAAMRHLQAFADGEDLDPETGESHIAHLRCCTAFLIEYQAKNLGTDDRHKEK